MGSSSAKPLSSTSFLFWAAKSLPDVGLEGERREKALSCGQQSNHPPLVSFINLTCVNYWHWRCMLRHAAPTQLVLGGHPVSSSSIVWEKETSQIASHLHYCISEIIPPTISAVGVPGDTTSRGKGPQSQLWFLEQGCLPTWCPTPVGNDSKGP